MDEKGQFFFASPMIRFHLAPAGVRRKPRHLNGMKTPPHGLANRHDSCIRKEFSEGPSPGGAHPINAGVGNVIPPNAIARDLPGRGAGPSRPVRSGHPLLDRLDLIILVLTAVLGAAILAGAATSEKHGAMGNHRPPKAFGPSSPSGRPVVFPATGDVGLGKD
jgi:hypothetical protein